MSGLVQILDSYSAIEVERMAEQVKIVYIKYFRSMKQVTMGVLKSLEARIYPNTGLIDREKVGDFSW